MARRKYDAALVPKVTRLRQAGFGRYEIARLLDIPDKTFRNWAKQHEELEEAILTEPVIASATEDLGRPTRKYSRKLVKQAFKHCLLGATTQQLADFFEVNRTTIHRWQNDYPEFHQAIRAGKRQADANVAASLYHRAIGYSHPAVHFGKATQTNYVKHYPPDTAAIIFWMKNREPTKWRDKREIVIEDSEELTPWDDLATLDDEEDDEKTPPTSIKTESD